MSNSWSLAITVPHRERAVSRMLVAYDFPFHLFCEMRQRVWRGRLVERAYPIFPGYLFVRCHGLWEQVRSIVGVIGFVRLGEKINIIDDKVVASLVRASVDDVLPLQIPLPVTRFKFGDRVRIDGPSMLAGQIGIFQRMLTANQAVIEMDWMGRWVPIAVDERDLGFEQARRTRRPRRRPSSSKQASNSAIALSLA